MPVGNVASRQCWCGVVVGAEWSDRSERTNLLGAGALWPLPSFEGDLLAFLKVVEVGSDHNGHVEKQVLSFIGRDEAEALVGETLDCTFSHCVRFARENSSCQNVHITSSPGEECRYA